MQAISPASGHIQVFLAYDHSFFRADSAVETTDSRMFSDNGGDLRTTP